ncbi:DNA polymerase-3 subunit gamma/tau [Tindallia magadiensis]|uniref:DNA-directed DNA polymerase n=1 Tax=Tindallia magadiensis TaxID=69895 RepID=A0A1I3GGL2_9FIRM|nr:DNA polymerase III subunit gamma/tau [Tindallia magadiensis]SFI22281.1 DNA polymerase-3 subunit gamma/tau [Tindallia magadiensis]
MSYKALYRKWRPEVFEEVMGQAYIVQTLKNQIAADSISHAYLFSGIRGTGKTSTAKIFARAINCLDPYDGNPCNVCEVCRGILSDQVMDVLEIDAASNNGVDHIREIRESVKYPPVKGKYKVYIIDEVHMLSSGAFNALLKTLEEPPEHVVFILATTELHKIPPTVLSRCLRFNFKPLSMEEIKKRLEIICRSLDMDCDDGALTTVAINGEGALRDALSILDQCIAYHPGQLSYEHVIEVLGSINEDLLFQMTDHIAHQKPLKVAELLQQLYLEGKDMKQLLTELMKHFRWLMMASLKAKIEGWEAMPEAKREKLIQQAAGFETRDITEMIRKMADIEFSMKKSAQPYILLESGMIALASPMPKAAPPPAPSVQADPSPKTAQPVQKPKAEAKPSPEKKPAAAPAPEPTHQPSPTEGNSEGLLELVRQQWPEVLEQIRLDKKASIQAMAREGKIMAIEGEAAVLGFDQEHSFHCNKLDREDIKSYLSRLLKDKTGKSLRIKLQLLEDNKQSARQQQEQVIEKLKEVVPENILEIVEEE